MEQLGRVNLYRNLIERSTSNTFTFALTVNLYLLEDIEQSFLTPDIENGEREVPYFYLLETIRRNIQGLHDINTRTMQEERALLTLISKINKLVKEYEKKDGTNRKDGRNLFNQIIRELGTFNEKVIQRLDFDENAQCRGNKPQVFLSHAYVDKAYTWALFDYFYAHGIYLYVDWMHNDEESDGRVLKDKLKRCLNQSSQLLFLRTLNSELDIQGKQYIKPWCSWELGGFYNGKNPNEKYLLNLYSVDNYRNIQLHGLKLYTEIRAGKMQGNVIAP